MVPSWVRAWYILYFSPGRCGLTIFFSLLSLVALGKMTTNLAIVDDGDRASIIYGNGVWSTGGEPEEFDGTTMFTVTQGATATFHFVGTSITIYVTISAKNRTPRASWTFVFDGSIAGTHLSPFNLTADIHRKPVWTSPSSSATDAPHTLVITQTVAPSDGVIYLDYLIYTTTSTSVGSYFLDDSDPRITYQSTSPK